MDKAETQKEQGAEEAKKQPKAKPPDPRLPVRLVAHKGDSALVEWIEAGMYCRVYVPLDRVDRGTVASKDLAKGIPYGLPWEQWIEIQATPERIANELRRMGVWCWQDITNAALDTANRAFDKGAFLRLVNQEVNKNE